MVATESSIRKEQQTQRPKLRAVARLYILNNRSDLDEVEGTN